MDVTDTGCEFVVGPGPGPGDGNSLLVEVLLCDEAFNPPMFGCMSFDERESHRAMNIPSPPPRLRRHKT